MKQEFLFVEKYRPQKIEECVLPTSLKDTFQDIVNYGVIAQLVSKGMWKNE